MDEAMTMDTTRKAVIEGALRHVMTTSGGMVATGSTPTVFGYGIDQWIGLLVAVCGLVLSIMDKVPARNNDQ